jgi:predicted TIM-barrel fold metal-dependent hydrolase
MNGLRPIDLHVHAIGNGLSGSGCRVQPAWWQRPFLELMARDVGVKADASHPDFDQVYLERLIFWLNHSDLAGVVLLACDNFYTPAGECCPDRTRLYVPNGYVFAAAKKDSRLLPGISIHPARHDALEELDRCLEEGAVLLKLLPCVQNVDPSLRRYRQFWERIAECGLPLLAHTGGEFSLPVFRRDLQDPECLRVPLDLGVKVIAAHCGAPALPWDRDYSSGFASLRGQYPNLYGDISALSQLTHLKTLAQLREDPVRVVYGSDFPVVTTTLPSRLAGWISRDQARRLQRTANPLQRKLELTRQLGFPASIFESVYKVLHPSPALAALQNSGSALAD